MRGFFTELIALRKSTVGDSRDITHLHTGNGIFACVRENEGRRYLVAINLAGCEQSADLEGVNVRLDGYKWLVQEL